MPFFDNINTDSRFWCPFILACLTRKPWGEVDTAQYSLLQFLKNSIFDECFDMSIRKRIIQEFLLRTSTSVTLHGILLVDKINCKNRIHYWNTVSQLLPMRQCCMDCCLAIFLLEDNCVFFKFVSFRSRTKGSVGGENFSNNRLRIWAEFLPFHSRCSPIPPWFSPAICYVPESSLRGTRSYFKPDKSSIE